MQVFLKKKKEANGWGFCLILFFSHKKNIFSFYLIKTFFKVVLILDLQKLFKNNAIKCICKRLGSWFFERKPSQRSLIGLRG